MTIRKRLTALTLLFAFLAAVTACGAAAEAPEMPAAIRFISVPDEAFGEEGRMPIAGTPDGSRLLISGTFALYIWDTQEGKRIPLTFSREEDVEFLDMRIREAALFSSQAYSGMKKDEKAAYEEEIKKMADSYLASKGLTRFTSPDQALECFDHIISLAGRCAGMNDAFALVQCDRIGLEILTDLRTGESRLIGTDPEKRGSQFPSVVCGDRIFCKDGLLHMDTWESDYPAENYGFPAYADFTGEVPEIMLMYSAAALLPDDSLLIVNRGVPDREAGTTPSYLGYRSKAESRYTLLGQYPGMNGPDRLLVTGSKKYALAYLSNYYAQPAVLVNLETLETQEAEAGLFFFAACEGGFLAYDCRDRERVSVIVLDPETMQPRELEIRGDFTQVGDMMIISRIEGNGQGLLFTSSSPLHGYFTLE